VRKSGFALAHIACEYHSIVIDGGAQHHSGGGQGEKGGQNGWKLGKDAGAGALKPHQSMPAPRANLLCDGE